MGNSVRLRALALVAAGILGAWSVGGAAAAVGPGADHVDQSQHQAQGQGRGQGPGQGRGRHDKTDDEKKDKKGGGAGADGDRAGHGGHGGNGGNGGQTAGQAGGHGDPAGNNGTVKITGPGDEVGQPSDDPHPGCTVLVEWFGYDEGADVVSTVTFASQAPTSDAVLGGTSPARVFVGGDAAGGGTDLDGRQAYTLTFQGEPHPQQGYHVKLTVATPHSLGNDTKSKVFWVEPCADVAASETPSTAALPADTPVPTQGTGAGVGARSLESPEASSTTGRGVLGETFVADDTAAEVDAARAGGEAVPTAVDAGESSALPQWARSPLPLTLISFALVLAGAGMVLRDRSRA